MIPSFYLKTTRSVVRGFATGRPWHSIAAPTTTARTTSRTASTISLYNTFHHNHNFLVAFSPPQQQQQRAFSTNSNNSNNNNSSNPHPTNNNNNVYNTTPNNNNNNNNNNKNPLLDAFRDPVDRQTRSTEKVGRSWSAKELRRKSYQDLHRLWYVLYKERNMLLTEQQLSRRKQLSFPQPERLTKVQKSMGAIKQVLGERKREKVAAHNQQHQMMMMEQSMQAESLNQTEEVVVEGPGTK
jgi:Mitochondrial 39-S ribosomal protein L47 (MRP-L47)